MLSILVCIRESGKSSILKKGLSPIELLRSIADGFHKRSLHGKPFAVFRMDEFEYCAKKFPSSSPGDEIHATCDALSNMSPEYVSFAIKSFLEEQEIEFVYLTVPVGAGAVKVEKIRSFIEDKARVFSDLKVHHFLPVSNKHIFSPSSQHSNPAW